MLQVFIHILLYNKVVKVKVNQKLDNDDSFFMFMFLKFLNKILRNKNINKNVLLL